MNQQALITLFEQFILKRIAIIGDVMIDSYLWGKTERISPEAPVPVVSVTKRESRMGGAANVAINIKSLGAEPIMIAIIGNDSKGHEFLGLMQKAEIEQIGILISDDRKTTVKHRVIASNQHLLRIDEELSNPLEKNLEERFATHCINVLEQLIPDAIIFEDYDKGNITPLVISQIVNYAIENNIPTLVDPKKRNFEYYKNVTLFKPNFKELIEGMKLEGVPKDNPKAIADAANKLLKYLNASNVMVTLSEQGILVTNGKKFFHMPAQKREIADVSGAGDTVISVSAVLLACSINPEEMATIANIAGGLVCEKPGVVPVNKETLLKECIEYYEK